MILIDYSQIAIANLVIALKQEGNLPTPEMARYMILNSIRGYVHTYKEEYGPEVVIAVDGKHPWRRDIFPAYKAKRRERREDEDHTNTDLIYEYMDIIRREIEENFPYKTIKLDGVEADDIIAVCVKKNVDGKKTNKKCKKKLKKHENLIKINQF